jgi:hypothetical protein
LFIDSIIVQGYQSDEIFKDADKEPELVVPYQSAESEEEIDFRSEQSKEEQEEEPAEESDSPQARLRAAKKKQKAASAIKIPDKATFKFHGFDIESLQAYPHQYVEGSVPAMVLREDI